MLIQNSKQQSEAFSYHQFFVSQPPCISDEERPKQYPNEFEIQTYKTNHLHIIFH